MSIKSESLSADGPAVFTACGQPRRRIETSRRSHPPFEGEGPNGVYAASTWDHNKGCWELYAENVPRMGLRKVIRELEDAGWSTVSYLIERTNAGES